MTVPRWGNKLPRWRFILCIPIILPMNILIRISRRLNKVLCRRTIIKYCDCDNNSVRVTSKRFYVVGQFARRMAFLFLITFVIIPIDLMSLVDLWIKCAVMHGVCLKVGRDARVFERCAVIAQWWTGPWRRVFEGVCRDCTILNVFEIGVRCGFFFQIRFSDIRTTVVCLAWFQIYNKCCQTASSPITDLNIKCERSECVNWIIKRWRHKDRKGRII